MEIKKYLAHNPINGDYEDFDIIQEAQEWLEASFLDSDEGYHPDAEDCCIYQLVEKVKLTIIDEKINYKYESEDDVPEDDQKAIDDLESEVLGFLSEVERKVAAFMAMGK